MVLLVALSACTPAPTPAPLATTTPSRVPPASPTSAPTLSPAPTLTSVPPTPLPLADFGPGPVEIPILLYHRVSPDGSSNRYTVGAADFQAQLAFLAANGYQTVTIADVASAIRQGARLPLNPVVLTFDDGNLDTYTEAWPRMQPFGFIGVVYVVANRLGAEGFLAPGELGELARAGWEIGSHSSTHSNLVEGERSRWRDEILGSRLELERVLGWQVVSFAYPFGVGSSDIFRKTSEYGYQTGVGLGKGILHDRGSLFYLQRREVLGGWSLTEFEAALAGS